MREDQQDHLPAGYKECTLATDGDAGNLIESLQGWLIYQSLNQEVQFSKLENYSLPI